MRAMISFGTLVLALALTVQLLSGSGSASAGERKYTIDSRGKHLYRPHTLYFGAHERIRSIHWRSWGGPRARGRGTYPVNDCIPACAFGTITPYPVKLVLKRLHGCKGRQTYLRLIFIFDRRKPPERPRRGSVPQGFLCSAGRSS